MFNSLKPLDPVDIAFIISISTCSILTLTFVVISLSK